MKKYFLSGLIVMIALFVSAQKMQDGYVTDSVTGAPAPFVKVYAKVAKKFIDTDTAGYFKLPINASGDTLIFRDITYRERKIPVIPGPTLNVQLVENSVQFEMVEVRPGENPAYKILRKVHEHKRENDPYEIDAYECDVYNKMQFSLDNLSEKFKERKLVKQLDFILEYVDTTNGVASLPVLFAETSSRMYYKNSPELRKEVIKATRVVGIEQLDLTKYTGGLSTRFNVYDRNIGILGRDFLSPIAKGGKAFYKYYKQDDDTINGEIFHHLKFKPRRKGTAVFSGEIWIDDSTYAVTHVSMIKPEGINVNYLKDFEFEQKYEKLDGGRFVPISDVLKATFNLFEGGDTSRLAGVQLVKTVDRSQFEVGKPKANHFYKEKLIVESGALERGEAYWAGARPGGLKKSEESVSEMIDSLKRNPKFQMLERTTHFAFTGYWKAGPIEIGNLYSLYNRNVVEGHRFRLTLRTSKQFSKHMRITAFGAYGLKDQRFKYGAKMRWKVSASPHEVLEFSYKKDIDQLALGYTRFDFGRSLAMFLANRPVDKLNMVNTARINYEKDWSFNMRTNASLSWTQLTPLGNLKYRQLNEKDNKFVNVASVSAFQFEHSAIFTKEEKFISGAYKRISLGSRYPIVSLTHTLGVSEVLKKSNVYNKLEFAVQQTLRLGVAGKLKYRFYTGKVYGKAPFPFLNVHSGSETYYLQKHGFNLMQYYEFVSDEWVGLNFEHHLNGLIMDRIPLINKLKIRTVYGAKAIIGSYSKDNGRLLSLPSFSQSLNGKPYAEVSVGIENLLKCIRVDAVWRLTHRNQIGLGGIPAPKFGVRVMFATAL